MPGRFSVFVAPCQEFCVPPVARLSQMRMRVVLPMWSTKKSLVTLCILLMFCMDPVRRLLEGTDIAASVTNWNKLINLEL